MPVRKELIIDRMDSRGPVPGTSLVAAQVLFREPQANVSEYILEAQINKSPYFQSWGILDNDTDKEKSILFQVAERGIDELVHQNQLDTVRRRPDAVVVPYVFPLDPSVDISRCPFDLTKVVPKLPFTRIFWQRSGDSEKERRESMRLILLWHLYDIANRPRNDSISPYMFDIANRLGISKEAVQRVFDYWQNEGYAEAISLGPEERGAAIKITHEGIKYIEQLEDESVGMPPISTGQPVTGPFYMTGDNIHPKIAEKTENVPQKNGVPITSRVSVPEQDQTGRSAFISYSQKDKEYVRELKARLENDGAKIWIDDVEINIGDHLIDKISEAIKENKYMVVVLSRNSVESNWVKQELSWAMDREIRDGDVTVLPVLIEECEVPAFLRDKYYADFTSKEKREENYPKLLRTIK